MAALVLALVAGACGSGSPTPPSAAVSRSQIATAYSALFNFSDKSLASKEVVVQDGKSLAVALQQGETSPLASGVAGARVNSTTVLTDAQCQKAKVPAPCEKVAFDIMGSGNTVVAPNETGYASYATGKWLVAKVTICSLLDSLYSVEQKTGTPPGCPAP